jgi:hypothetical protein
VAAARAVLDGAERRLDLLVDDSDGVVLGALRIPAPPPPPTPPVGPGVPPHPPSWLRVCRESLVRTLSPRPARVRIAPPARLGPSRLRVEVDGVTLVDLDQPVEAVSIAPATDGTGGADVEIRPVSVGAEATPLRAVGHRVTVSGADFRYGADSMVSGPVRTRTWTVREGAWGLTLPG